MKLSHLVLMSTASLLAIASTARAQTAQGQASDLEGVVVTGSRVITNGNQAPTPVTVVTTERLMETAPSSVPDALQRLPQFFQAPRTQSIGNAGSNSTANTLSLRRFGANRNLILLDGSRVPPTAASGAVDTNIIPQSLVQRVEVVTGGASAVYGSDAVTGVINFILDKNFTGFKATAQAGISEYGDNESAKFGAAWGTDLFGGRGHFEASYDWYKSLGVSAADGRPESDVRWISVGNGTVANPTRLFPAGTFLTASRGGYINPSLNAGIPASLRDVVFKETGVAAVPFTHGQATGSNGAESGGDGGYFNNVNLITPIETNQVFARFDYDLTDSINAFAQIGYNDSEGTYNHFPIYFLNARIFSGNPYIPAPTQAAMTAGNVQSFVLSRMNDFRDGYPNMMINQFSTNVFAKTGLEGTVLDNWRWNANYTFNRSTQRVTNRNNPNAEKTAAALDAVIDPATGRPTCAVLLTAQASRFAGCQPLNIIGYGSPTLEALDFVTDDTRYTLANLMHDVNLSVSGSPFSLWAGPVTVAVSGEYRWLELRNISNAEPTYVPNCTGLRGCGGAMWASDSTANMAAKQNVKELAGEVLIPLLTDAPFFQSLELNLAARHTDYSTSGKVNTWKIGGSWAVNDELRLRATRSKDIRAPTLQDLFAPTSSSIVGFTDIHTGLTRQLLTFRQGNPNLTPEIGKTTTAGIVYQPNWLPRFSIALDYFEIMMRNAIVSQGFNNTAQRECEDTNGASPLCALAERPLPFSDRTAANFPLRTFNQGVNAQRQWTRGWDIEANYRMDVPSVIAGTLGQLSIRALATYQPLFKSQTILSTPPSEAAGNSGFSKVRINTSLSYTAGGLSVSVTDRWQSHQFPSDPRTFVDTREMIGASHYFDLSLSYRLEVGGNQFTPFVTVENLFDRKAPIVGGGASVPNLTYPGAGGFDIVGRYYTAGIRARF